MNRFLLFFLILSSTALAQSGLKSLVVWALSDNDPAVEFYKTILRFSVVASDEATATGHGRVRASWT